MPEQEIEHESMIEQLDREKRSVSYDAYDIAIRQLIDMARGGEINIAPDYQRHFVWKDDRESELIESLYLGIPVPSLFMATNKDGTWEVVDGVQRISTLLHFCGGEEVLGKIGRDAPLRLKNLTKLSALNNMTFKDLPSSVQLAFMLRPMRVTTLNDKSDLQVRYELFERLNTGGVSLHSQEIRGSVFRGPINKQIKDLAKNEDFRKILIVPNREKQTEAVYEECVVRFFAFEEKYTKFPHLVTKFLNDYMKEHNSKGIHSSKIDLFEKVMEFVARELPDGITRARNATPLNLYEAVTVGTALTMRSGANPKKGVLAQLLNDADLTKMTQSGTNNRKMVVGRIEFVRDALS